MSDFMDGYMAVANNRSRAFELKKYSDEQSEKIKKESDAARAADYFFKANPEGLAALGETAESFKNKSAPDRYGAMVAYGQAMLAKEQQQKQSMQALQMAQIQSGMQQERMDASRLANFHRSYDNVTTPMQIPPGTFGPMYRGETVGGPLDQRGVFNLAQRSRLNPQQTGEILRAYGQTTPDAEVGPPVVANIGGHDVMYSRKTGKYDLLDRSQTQQGMTFDQRLSLMDRQAKLREKAIIAKDINLMQPDNPLRVEAQKRIDAIDESLNPTETTVAPQAAPKAGTVVNGYRFKGGNPNSKESWEKVN